MKQAKRHNVKPPKPSKEQLEVWHRRKCPHCDYRRTVRLIDSLTVYNSDYGMIWECEDCEARVGCHKNSPVFKPLGTVANPYLRRLRIAVHTLFDRLVQRKMETTGTTLSKARTTGYEWFANIMEMDLGKCHVAWFREDDCYQAFEIFSLIPTSIVAQEQMKAFIDKATGEEDI